MIKELFDFVFCCPSQEQQEMVETAMENHNPAPVYYAQQNLVREKHGYRCSICGKFYPYIELAYQGIRIDPRKYAKAVGEIRKGKKAAVIFNEQFYYAQNKKALLKFEADSGGVYQETNTIPVMGGVYHVIASHDEKYIATETFGGTIAVLDVCTGQCIAKKQKTHINGSFIFTQDHKLMYYFKNAVRLWDFCEDTDLVVWSVPEKWKTCGDARKQINVVCRNIIHNRRENTYLFVCGAIEATYVVAVKNMKVERVIQLPKTPANCKLVFEENLNQYTLPTDNCVIVYDSDFCVVETIVPPHIVKNHDGGGEFPITRHLTRNPNRAFLSPDGKWLLLDCFTSVILMRREDRSIQFCLYSYNGRVAQNMGFLDDRRIWYTWGDTTYIQEIEK